ncbi:single-stranded-DNA-specific exonuclease RecJ [Candidatus Dependentiae bacterium]
MNLEKNKAGFRDIKLNFDLIKGEKFLWRLKKSDKAVVRKIACDCNLSISVAQVLFVRGFKNKKQINSFIFPSIKENVFDPKLLKDSDKAIDRINLAINKKEKILVFGDYDVDGITSTSLLMVSLLPLGADINFYLPNRIKDGYGLSEKIVKRAYENKYKLIITVDNGITANKAAKLASKLGVDLIITDHHRPQKTLPKAVAIIDANQKDCSYPYKDLAGVGVIFKIISMLYKQKNLKLPDKIYELLMLGTVADVAPLTSENRFWVKYGLGKINKKKSIALNSLVRNGNLLKERLDSLDIGFIIAPQLNALGRLDDPRNAVRFLISSDTQEVDNIGLNLRDINERRKLVDRKIYQEIEMAIFEKRIDIEKENIIIAASDKWPAGVIGLVAGKLTHNYGKPSLLFNVDKNGILKGSCRSIPEFNIFDALNENKDLLLSFGGHSFAAGLKLEQKNLPELKLRLEEKISRELTPQDLIPKLEIDANLELTDMTINLLSDLQNLEPFGNKNLQPVFCIKNVTLLNEPKLLKERHVKCSIFADGIIKPVIFFNRPELFYFLSNIGENHFDLAANVVKNEWDGRTNIELQGLDISLKG